MYAVAGAGYGIAKSEPKSICGNSLSISKESMCGCSVLSLISRLCLFLRFFLINYDIVHFALNFESCKECRQCIHGVESDLLTSSTLTLYTHYELMTF